MLHHEVECAYTNVGCGCWCLCVCVWLSGCASEWYVCKLASNYSFFSVCVQKILHPLILHLCNFNHFYHNKSTDTGYIAFDAHGKFRNRKEPYECSSLFARTQETFSRRTFNNGMGLRYFLFLSFAHFFYHFAVSLPSCWLQSRFYLVYVMDVVFVLEVLWVHWMFRVSVRSIIRLREFEMLSKVSPMDIQLMCDL